MSTFDVAILGAGAAGLMCAHLAGLRGLRVVVLEHSNKPGRKILMSGGGRCNFTNRDVSADNYLCDNPHFVKSALARYTPWDFIELVERHNIAYHERAHGQLFCDQSAKDILNMLLRECQQAQVDIQTRTQLLRIERQADAFLLTTSRGAIHCPKVVIATGGLSIPSMGGDGLGYQLAEQFGLRLTPRRAGLVPLRFSGALQTLTDTLSGNAIPVRARAHGPEFEEALLFTHRGLSGPSMLQISNYWQEGQKIHINLLPGDEIAALLADYRQSHPRMHLRNLLARHLPRAVVVALEPFIWPQHATQAIAQIPEQALHAIAAQLANWQIKPSGTEGYRTAEVTLGGVDTEQLSSRDMAVKTVPGLHFIGEVVDVSGQLGGYNFQWAWASAYAAASGFAH